MINRYSITADSKSIAERFSVDPTGGYSPNYNAAPTHLLPVLTQESPSGLSFFYWGTTPAWANQKALAERLINAQAEMIAEKSVLRKKLKTHRLLIPADGFYLWKKIGKKAAVPYRFTLMDKSLFVMPGFWEEYEDTDGARHHTFTIITTVANESVASFSERMPAILPPQSEKEWLESPDEKGLLALLTPNSVGFDHYSVSSRVNNPDRNDRIVIQPAPAADQFGNLTLFD